MFYPLEHLKPDIHLVYSPQSSITLTYDHTRSTIDHNPLCIKGPLACILCISNRDELANN